MSAFVRDCRYAARLLRKSPGFSAAVLFTLTLGIGATTAIFSVLNATLLHPLPFSNADRLLRLYDVRRREDGQLSRVSFSARNFHQVREQTQAFDSVAAQIFLNLNLVIDDTPERVVGIGVSDGWLATLGVQPVLGRGFTAEEEKGGSDSGVALVSYGFWERRFGSSAQIIGESITLDNRPCTVIGVLPRGFEFPYHSEVWLPYRLDYNNGRAHALNVLGRLKRNISIEQAQTDLDIIADRLAGQFPDTNAGYSIGAVSLRDVLIEGREKLILFLLAAVGFLLLIACANITNLLLARAIGREKEFAIRAALGASRLRQIQQLLTENILFSLLGGAAGVLLTLWARDFLISLVPPELTYVMREVPVDLSVLGFALLISLLIGATIAIVPALRTSRFNLQSLLKEGGRSSRSASNHRLLSIFVVGEIALALVLLTGASVMVQHLYRLKSAHLGFAKEDLITMKISLTGPQYADPQRRSAFVQEVVEKIEALPGTQGVAAANLVPLTSGNVTASFVEEGKPVNPNEQYVVSHRIVNPEYFDALRIPLLRGRVFSRQDDINSQPVVIINQRMVQRFFGNEDPIGKRVRPTRANPQSQSLTIVGVVGDVEETTPSREIKETWYVPFAQDSSAGGTWYTSSIQLAVRAEVGPAALLPTIKEAISQADRNSPVFDVATAEDLYSGAISQTRFTTTLITGFSGFGLLMAMLGTYGVCSYGVSQRTHEIGVRLALGARASDIISLLLKQSLRLALTGVAIGLTGAVMLSRLMASVLPELASPNQQLLLVVVATLLTLVALLACYLPARRAIKIDPMIALRCE
jgi:putative ABC transport system permease protein